MVLIHSCVARVAQGLCLKSLVSPPAEEGFPPRVMAKMFRLEGVVRNQKYLSIDYSLNVDLCPIIFL